MSTDRIQKKILLRGMIVPTTVNAEVAKAQKAYEGLPFEITIEKMEPERLFSFTWHPYAIDPKQDYSGETPTLIEFTLEKTATGTRLRVVESGFDKLPAHRRDEAFRMNEGGWTAQIQNIARHVEHEA